MDCDKSLTSLLHAIIINKFLSGASVESVQNFLRIAVLIAILESQSWPAPNGRAAAGGIPRGRPEGSPSRTAGPGSGVELPTRPLADSGQEAEQSAIPTQTVAPPSDQRGNQPADSSGETRLSELVAWFQTADEANRVTPV